MPVPLPQDHEPVETALPPIIHGGGTAQYLRDGITAALTVCLAVGLCCWAMYMTSVQELKGQVDKHLLDMAAFAAAHVDPDQHARIVQSARDNIPEAKAAMVGLENVRGLFQNMQHTFRGVVYVYTMAMVGEDVRFIVDPTPEGDADKDGVDDKATFMERYDDPSPALLRALQDGIPTVDDKPYTDKWGSFISAFYPLQDRHHREVGVIGIDMRASAYYEELSNVRRTALIGGGIGGLYGFLVGCGVYFISRAKDGLRRREEEIRYQLQRTIEQMRYQLKIRDSFITILTRDRENSWEDTSRNEEN